MDISTFMANFRGGARPNRYRVIINYPGFAGAPPTPSYLICKAASLPAFTVGTIEVPYMGRQAKFDGDRTLESWSVTMINDTLFDHRNAMERWSNGLNGITSNIAASQNFSDRVSTITVDQLANDGAVLKRYKLLYAFPTNVGAIELAFDQNDQVEEFPVEFQYSDMIADTTS